MNKTEKNREARLRRIADKAGYALRKSRAAEGLDNFGGYMIVDTESNFVADGSRFDLDLDYVENWLSEMT